MTEKMRPEGLKATLRKLINDYGAGFVISTIGSILSEMGTGSKAEKQETVSSYLKPDPKPTPDDNQLYVPVYRKKGETKWLRAKDKQGKKLPAYIYSSVARVYGTWLRGASKDEERRLMPLKKKGE